MIRVAGTGHRPDKLGGYSDKAKWKLFKFLRPELELLCGMEQVMIISGMAQGFDLCLAYCAIDLGIPFTAAIPCPQQERLWPKDAQEKYHKILSKAATVVTVCARYSPSCMQTRNEWMVDNCDTLLALFNGSCGGTRNCIEYARKMNRRVVNLWDKWKSLPSAS